MATRRDDGPYSAPPVDSDDGYEILESVDLLDEGELILEDDEDDGGFDEEATAVFRPEEHGELASEGRLDAPLAAIDDDEATTVRDIEEIEAESRTTVRPSPISSSGGVSDVAPARGADPWEEEATIVTDPASFGDAEPSPRVPLTSGPVIAVPAPRPPADKRGPGVLPIVLVVMLAIALGVLVYVAVGMNRAPVDDAPVAETTPTTTLAVFSSPRGATVTVDGQPHDLPTPTTLRGLEVGRTYAITIEREGYQPTNDSITPSGTEPMQREYQLEPTAGSLDIVTVPSGAELVLDDRPLGTSPARADDLDRGRTWVVTARLEGHEDETRLVRWTDDAPAEQTVTLQLRPADLPTPDADAGDLDADPAGAEATEPPAAEAPVAAAAPEREPAAAPRERRPEPEPEPVRPSQRPSERPAAAEPEPEPVRPSQRPSERVQQAEPEVAVTGTGTLSVQAVPYGQVWIDDAMVAAETPLLNHTLSAGVHRVKVYFVPLSQFSEERAIRVEPGSARTVTFRASR